MMRLRLALLFGYWLSIASLGYFAHLIFPGAGEAIAYIAIVPAMLTIAIVPYVEARVRSRQHVQRFARVRAIVVQVPDAIVAKELEFRDRLMIHVRDTLAPGSVIKEYPLPMKTKVDGYFEYDGTSWFVSIKLDLTPQSRKILQGECEDVIRGLRDDESKARICVVLVIALPEELDLDQSQQLDELRRYADDRVAQMITKDRLIPRFAIEVMLVRLAPRGHVHKEPS